MASRATCLTVDKRWYENYLRVVAYERLLNVEIKMFLAGDGKTVPLAYDHVDVVPPPRSGYPAWANRPNSYNAFLCFRKMVTAALEDGAESLLIMEDDVLFEDEPLAADVITAAWRELAELDPEWDALYFGANHTYCPTTQVAPHLLRLNGSGCFHCVLMSRRAFPKLLALPMREPIDGCFGKLVHPDGHSYGVWPNVALTKPGFSHCEGGNVDYREYFKNKGCA